MLQICCHPDTAQPATRRAAAGLLPRSAHVAVHQRHLLTLLLHCLPAARPARRWRTRRCRCGSGSNASRVRWRGAVFHGSHYMTRGGQQMMDGAAALCCLGAVLCYAGLVPTAGCCKVCSGGRTWPRLQPGQPLGMPLTLPCRPERLRHLLQPWCAAQQQGRRSAVSGRRAAVLRLAGRARQYLPGCLWELSCCDACPRASRPASLQA